MAHILGQSLGKKAAILADQRAVLTQLHTDGKIDVGVFTNKRTLETLISLVEIGLVAQGEFAFTLSERGQAMMQRVSQ